LGAVPNNGKLPHRLIIFRFASSGTVREARWLDSEDFLSSIVCYEFDLTKDFALTDTNQASGTTGVTNGSTQFNDPNYAGFTTSSIGQTLTIFIDGSIWVGTVTDYASPSSVTLSGVVPVGANLVWFITGDAGLPIAPIVNLFSYRDDKLVLNSHVDGGLFGAYFDTALGVLTIIDNDDPTQQWQGDTALEKYWPMGEPLLRKAMTEVTLKVEGDFSMTIANGQRDASSEWCATYGDIDRRVKISDVIDPRSPLRKRIRGSSYETTSIAPLTRMVTNPDANGNHSVEYQAIGLDVAPVNSHP
jgi:hypothetical protein